MLKEMKNGYVMIMNMSCLTNIENELTSSPQFVRGLSMMLIILTEELDE